MEKVHPKAAYARVCHASLTAHINVDSLLTLCRNKIGKEVEMINSLRVTFMLSLIS